MTGIEDFNAPAFDSAEYRLTELGYEVFNPIKKQRHHIPNKEGMIYLTRSELIHTIIKPDIEALLHCDMMFVLNGWEESVGVAAELRIAQWAEINIIYEKEGYPNECSTT